MRKRSQQKILRAATRLFAEEGYEHTSMSLVAKKAKVSKGLIYNYYESKVELLKAVTEKIMEEAMQLMPDMGNADPKEALKASIDYSIEVMRKYPDYMGLIIKLSFQVNKFPFLQKMIRGKSEFLFGMLEQSFTALGYDDPHGESLMLGAMLDGIAIEAIALGDAFWYDEIKQSLFKKYGL